MNNVFLSRVKRFGNDFHECLSHEWKLLPIRLTSDKISLFTLTNVLFYFLHAIWCHEHTNPLRTIIERSFRLCCQGRPFLTEHCDVTTIDLWRHANAYTGIVTSYLLNVIARANWRKGDLQWITAVNIDISLPGIDGLACKKQYFMQHNHLKKKTR